MTKSELSKERSEFLVTVQADEKVWKQEQEKAFNKICGYLEVKGFRKGKVPVDVARKNVTPQQIFQEAVRPTLDILIKDAAKEVKEDTLVLDAPTYSVEKISDKELEVTFAYPVYPEIKLADYKKIKTAFEEPKFDAKEVDAEIDRIVQSRITNQPVEGKIKKGHIVNLDYKGLLNGEAFEGGTAKGHTLEIGSGQFIPGFEDQMIGMALGEEKDLNVTFPKEYHSKDLAGQPVVFQVKVNSISEKVTPKLDDKFVEELKISDEIKTVAQLKEHMTTLMKDQKHQMAKGEFQRKAFEELKKDTEMVIPAALIIREMTNQQRQLEEQLKQQGLTIEKYLQMTGMKPEVLGKNIEDRAVDTLTEAFIFAEISKAEKIEISDAEYDAEYEKYAKVYGKDLESIKGLITKQQMQIPMTNDRVIDKLISFAPKAAAKKTEAKKAPAAKKATTAAKKPAAKKPATAAKKPAAKK